MPIADGDYVSRVGVVWRPDPDVVLEVVSDLSAAAQRAEQREAPDLRKWKGERSGRRFPTPRTCADCGKPVSKGSRGRCVECARKERYGVL